MLRKILLGVGTLIVLGGVLIGWTANWARNPYGLEPERLGPKGSEALAPVSVVPKAKNYLLYVRNNKNTYAIHLPLPNEYIHESNTTNRMVKSYAVSVSMYYPEMNGKFNAKNTNLPHCNGWCGGYLRAFIEPDQDNAYTLNARTLERIKQKRKSNSPLYQFEDLDREFGFDEHFQIRYPAIEKRTNGNTSSTKEYFVKNDKNGETEYLFECLPYVPSPSCSVKFNLSSRPELLVDIMFGRYLMTDWQAIVASVDRKIASWGPAKIEVIDK